MTEPVIEVELPKEFSYDHNLAYLSRSPDECMYAIRDRKIYKGVPVPGEERISLIEIAQEAPTRLTVRFPGRVKPVGPNLRAAVESHVRDWFDLDNDLTPFYAMSENDPILSGVVPSLYGLRNMGMPDLFEAMCWGILGQQINLAFAYTLKKRVVEKYGRRIEGGGIVTWAFPEPSLIASLDVQDLTVLQLTTKKAEYLIGVAKHIEDGSLSKADLLSHADIRQVEKKLVSIRGIGPWTANYVLMRCLRYPSAFPIDDVGLHNAIKTVLGMDAKPTVPRIRELSRSWTNWEAYATFYLWRVLY